jgi:hypothetical protein
MLVSINEGIMETEIDEKRITLRLPTDVHASVAQLADQDVRSLNAEILVLLREAIAARKTEQRTTS